MLGTRSGIRVREEDAFRVVEGFREAQCANESHAISKALAWVETAAKKRGSLEVKIYAPDGDCILSVITVGDGTTRIK